DPAGLGDEGGVAEDAERSGARLGVVRDELADVGDEERACGHRATVEGSDAARVVGAERIRGLAPLARLTPAARAARVARGAQAFRHLIADGIAGRSTAGRVARRCTAGGGVARRSGKARVVVVLDVGVLARTCRLA